MCAVLLAALVSPSQQHAIGNATCGLKFQEHIKAAIAIKRKCASAVFDDCCQVLQFCLLYLGMKYNYTVLGLQNVSPTMKIIIEIYLLTAKTFQLFGPIR